MQAVCVDSCFLIAMYDPREEWHEKANGYFEQYLTNGKSELLIPWPVLYETVSTRMVRRRDRLAKIERDWNSLRREKRLEFIDDRGFREAAIKECIDSPEALPEHYRSMSLADRVIRSMLENETIKINTFITFNPRDFSDVCAQHGIALLY